MRGVKNVGLLTLAIAVVGCGPRRIASKAAECPEPAPPPVTGAKTQPLRPPGLAYLEIPAPRPDAELDAAAKAWVDATTKPAAGASTAPTTLILSPADAPMMPSGYPPTPKQGALGKAAQRHFRLLRTVPKMNLSQAGRFEVSFSTVAATPAASLYIGSEVATDPFASARFRDRVTNLSGSESGYRLTGDVFRLLKTRYDIGGIARRGRGVFPWRLELLDPTSSGTRLHDGRLFVRCAPTPCKKGATFVQLPSIVAGPVIDQVSPRSAIVSWTTDVPTAGAVLLHSDAESMVVARATKLSRRHEVVIDRLTAATRYRYHALSLDHRGEWSRSRGATFRTAPAPSESRVRFVVLSDSRSGNGTGDERYSGTNRRVLTRLLAGALEQQPDFIMFVGDLVDGYTSEAPNYRFELASWARAAQPYAAYVPTYETMGNHEALFDFWESGWSMDKRGPLNSETVFADAVVNPLNGPRPTRAEAPTYDEAVYSFDYGRVHMAVVNSNYWFRSHYERKDHPGYGKGYRQGWVDDIQLAWLDKDLKAARGRGAQHLFVSTHEPGFPNGGHLKDGMYHNGKIPEVLEQRAKLYQILDRHRVSAIFHGDEHNYSRLRVDGDIAPGVKGPIVQFITGGAGAPVYAQDMSAPWVANVEAFDAQQHFVVIDTGEAQAGGYTMSIDGGRMDAFELPSR